MHRPVMPPPLPTATGPDPVSPARHPSPVGRTAPRVRPGAAVTPEARAVDSRAGVDCRAKRPEGHGGRAGDSPCLDSRALRERGQRCLHGRDYARAATYYAQAEHLTLLLDGVTPDTTELAVLADYCLTQAARTQR